MRLPNTQEIWTQQARKCQITVHRHILGPKMDWTKDAGLHQCFKEWREEVEPLLDSVLAHIRNQETKLKYISLWAGKEARKYLNTVPRGQQRQYKNMLDTLEEWTKPKSNEIAAFTHLRACKPQVTKLFPHIFKKLVE